MTERYPALYECLTPGTDKWVECSAVHCARQRRINKNVDMLLRLEHYKSKLDAKLPLEPIEQEDLEGIAKHVSEMVEAFITAVTEALRPAIEVVAAAVKELWDSLPPDIQEALKTDKLPPLSVATPNLGRLNVVQSDAAISPLNPLGIVQRRSLS